MYLKKPDQSIIEWSGWAKLDTFIRFSTMLVWLSSICCGINVCKYWKQTWVALGGVVYISLTGMIPPPWSVKFPTGIALKVCLSASFPCHLSCQTSWRVIMQENGNVTTLLHSPLPALRFINSAWFLCIEIPLCCPQGLLCLIANDLMYVPNISSSKLISIQLE